MCTGGLVSVLTFLSLALEGCMIRNGQETGQVCACVHMQNMDHYRLLDHAVLCKYFINK